jgi:putative ABC transport system ATP-binding protein
MQDIIINASKLTRIYAHGDSEVVGLDRVDLTIETGEMVVLKGDSGSGKSTLLSLVAGLDRPTSGDLVVAKHDLSQSSEKTLTLFRRKVIGMVFQSFNLLPTLNVLENVYLPAMLAGRLDDDIISKASEYLRWIGLDHRLDHLPSQLSGGEMQRTAIARALINDPAIILADEPTGNLDSHNSQSVMTLLADLNRSLKRTVIVATHSNLAEPYSTRHIHLKDGKIAFQS